MSDAARIPVEVRQKFSQMREDIKKLSLTLQDVESQQAEYSIALSAIQKLPSDRKCFRLVGQALVEHTIGEVTPAIKDRRDQLITLQKGLGEQLEKLEASTTKYAVDHGLVRPANENPAAKKEEKSGDSKDSRGVLV